MNVTFELECGTIIHITHLAEMQACSRDKLALIPVPQIRCIHKWCHWKIQSLIHPKLIFQKKNFCRYVSSLQASKSSFGYRENVYLYLVQGNTERIQYEI